MAMILDLNTDELQNAVQIARRTNEFLTEAANLLNSVVIHNDWQCPERSEINNNTSRNRSQALALQSDAENLYNNINYAAEQFLAAEREIARSFDTVDTPIASFLSQVPSAVATDGGRNTGAWELAKDVVASAGSGLLGQLGGLKQGVDMVSFEDISDALRGK